MRISLATLCLAVLAVLAGRTFAAEPGADSYYADPSDEVTTARVVDYGDYYGQEDEGDSPSDLPVEPEAAAHNGHSSSCCDPCKPCCDPCCHSCCGGGLGDPWMLFGGGWLEDRGITVSGWLNGGFTWNPDSPGNRFNFPMVFNDRANEGTLNQFYLYADRPTDTGGYGFDVGGRVDFLYGRDHFFSTALGLETDVSDGSEKWNQNQRLYGLAMPQLYGQVAFNDLSFKIGHFYTIVGYEVVTARDQFFYSHTYTHQYGEPFTHTGVLGSYKLNDQMVIHSGFTRGWDNWEDTNDSLAYLGGITLTSADGDTALALGTHIGDEPGFGGVAGDIEDNRYYQSIVFSHKFNDTWSYVTGSDYGIQQSGQLNLATGALEDADWYSWYHYLYYTINDNWSLGGRFEYFRDEENFRILGAPLQLVGSDSAYYDITGGINWRPTANLRLRSEVRWDWGGPAGGFAGVFDDFSDRNQFTWGNDFIWTF